MTYPQVTFCGVVYTLVGDLENGGSLAVDEEFRAGRASYAHLFANGEILRFGRVIGTRSDLRVVGEVPEELDEDPRAIVSTLTDPSWRGR